MVSGFDTHENLLKTNRIYQEIYEAQTRAAATSTTLWRMTERTVRGNGEQDDE